jgi:hypothetical protein|tara:strand:- start:631 stop:741 length:111 start_codon:yes stop_codon:yes gene_type:complete
MGLKTHLVVEREKKERMEEQGQEDKFLYCVAQVGQI